VEFATASDMQEPAADILCYRKRHAGARRGYSPRGGFFLPSLFAVWLMENGFGT
jgi:hypothetical protein